MGVFMCMSDFVKAEPAPLSDYVRMAFSSPDGESNHVNGIQVIVRHGVPFFYLYGSECSASVAVQHLDFVGSMVE